MNKKNEWKLYCNSFFNCDKDKKIYEKAMTNSIKFAKEYFKNEHGKLFYRRSKLHEFREVKIILQNHNITTDNLKLYCDYFTEIIMKSHQDCYKFSKKLNESELFSYLKNDNSYDQYVYNDLCYKWNNQTDIINIIIDIVYKIASRHYLCNGNKRTAALTMGNLFKEFGLRIFFYDKDEIKNTLEDYIEYWFSLFNDIASHKNKEIIELKEKMYNILLNCLLIDFESIK